MLASAARGALLMGLVSCVHVGPRAPMESLQRAQSSITVLISSADPPVVEELEFGSLLMFPVGHATGGVRAQEHAWQNLPPNAEVLALPGSSRGSRTHHARATKNSDRWGSIDLVTEGARWRIVAIDEDAAKDGVQASLNQSFWLPRALHTEGYDRLIVVSNGSPEDLASLRARVGEHADLTKLVAFVVGGPEPMFELPSGQWGPAVVSAGKAPSPWRAELSSTGIQLHRSTRAGSLEATWSETGGWR